MNQKQLSHCLLLVAEFHAALSAQVKAGEVCRLRFDRIRNEPVVEFLHCPLHLRADQPNETGVNSRMFSIFLRVQKQLNCWSFCLSLSLTRNKSTLINAFALPGIIMLDIEFLQTLMRFYWFTTLVTRII